MYWHVAAYSESLGSVTDSDINAAQDDVYITRNSHLIFTEPTNLLALYGGSTTLTRARFGNQGLQQKGRVHLWPLARTDTIPSRPKLMDFTDRPMAIPLNEELTIEASTDAVGPVIVNFVLWLGDPRWSDRLPSGRDRFITRATAVVVAGAASAWTALASLVFERDLLNGVYAVVGAHCVAANAVAFRLRFPDQAPAGLKQLRPGGLVQNALGDFPWEKQDAGFGEWGRFHTFNPPQIQTFEDTAGGTYEVRLDLIYLGESLALLNRN